MCVCVPFPPPPPHTLTRRTQAEQRCCRAGRTSTTAAYLCDSSAAASSSVRAQAPLPGLPRSPYAHVCWRMLTYAHVCSRMLTYAHACSRMLAHADVQAPPPGLPRLIAFLFSNFYCSLLFSLVSTFALLSCFFFSFFSRFSVFFFVYNAGFRWFVQVTCMCVRVNACVLQVNRVRHHHVRAVLRALEKSGFVDVVPGRMLPFFF